MSGKRYIFSCWTRVRIPVLVRRPWWNLFGSDTIKSKEVNQRRIIADLDEEEGKLLMESEFAKTAPQRLFIKALGGQISMVQLEEDWSEGRDSPSQYISTSTGEITL